jgi:hypothetical protein
MSGKLQEADLAQEVAALRDRVRELRAALETVLAYAMKLSGPTVPPNGHEHDLKEVPVEPWKHLVWRKHPWRKQLSLKGRKITARQFVGAARAHEWDEQEAAKQFDLPVEAAREAFAYAADNAELLEAEVLYERMLVERKGEKDVPPVS